MTRRPSWLAAAKKIDAAASPTAIVTGSGAELDAVCESLRDSYGEIWKIRKRSPRLSQCRTCPQSPGKAVCRPAASCWSPMIISESICAPGLAIKLNRRFVSDVVDIEGVEGNQSQTGPPGIRRTGERPRSLRYLLGRGDQYTSRRIQASGRRCCWRDRGR